MLRYNTQENHLVLSEYGRGVQSMVDHLKTIEDKGLRTQMAEAIVKVMINLNPSIKELENYEQKLWDHLYLMAGYQLDVDGPFEVPKPEALLERPEKLGYNETRIRYRFYGRNLQFMVDSVQTIEDPDVKRAYLNYIASFMVNSSNNWNDEILTAQQVVQHLSDLSKGALQINPEELEIHLEAKRKKPSNYQGKKNYKKKKKRR